MLKISGGLVARNALWSFSARILPLIIGFVCMPFIIEGLGADRFGLLALSWSVILYFTVFDFGLGQATTKYVAEVIGQRKLDLIPGYVWTATLTQACLGVAAALILLAATPLLTEKFLKIPPALIGQSQHVLHILAVVIPLLLISNSFRGVLEASQRFDYITAVSIPASASTYVCPLMGVFFGWSLPVIVALIVTVRLVILAIFMMICFRLYPILLRLTFPDTNILRKVLGFGSWLTVSSIIIPLYATTDRFVVGSLVSIGAVAYYSTSVDLGRRLGIFSSILAEILFPAFSVLEGSNQKEKSQELFRRASKFQYLFTGLITILVVVLAYDIMNLWLGPDFAREGTRPLQIVAFGIGINSLGWVPFSRYMAAGRSDLLAKYHLIMLPIYILLTYKLTLWWGIIGTATAVCVNSVMVSFYNFFWAHRLKKFSSLRFQEIFYILMLLSVFAAASLITFQLTSIPLTFRLIFLSFLIIINFIFAWKFIFDDAERYLIRKLLNSITNLISGRCQELN